jgi:XTP/dITP diphosphohydrolase
MLGDTLHGRQRIVPHLRAMDKLILCTGNVGKVAELQALLPKHFTLLSLADLDLPNDLPETGDTLEANALQKARFVFQRTGMPCVADDTGLEVDALDGAPGVFSARYAGEARNAEANMTRLLKELAGRIDRSARFRTVLALVSDRGEETFEGTVEGTITHAPKGEHGFGYDPIFVPGGFSRTFAELDPAVKNSMSHRGQAVQRLIAHLSDL